MRPMRAWWWCLWLAMAPALVAPAAAAVDEQAFEAQQAASARLVALVRDADQADGDQAVRLARLRTAEFASLIQVVSDEERLLGSEPVPLADLGRAFDTCGAVQGVMAVMLFFDADRPGKPDPGRALRDPAVMALLDRNTITFQDELSMLQPFQFRCLAWLLPTLSDFVANQAPQEWTAVRREGLTKVRTGVVVMYTGAIPIVAADSLGHGYKRAVMDALVQHADVYVAVSSLADRTQIIAVLRTQRGKVPAAYVADIDRLIAAFSSTVCTGLCAIE